jgi:hypothetical protein
MPEKINEICKWFKDSTSTIQNKPVTKIITECKSFFWTESFIGDSYFFDEKINMFCSFCGKKREIELDEKK